MLGTIRWVWGEAELDVSVFGLDELFHEMASFVEGMAAERMYNHALRVLSGTAEATPRESLTQKVKGWEAGGFQLRRASAGGQ
jgi:hypothetical protein